MHAHSYTYTPGSRPECGDLVNVQTSWLSCWSASPTLVQSSRGRTEPGAEQRTKRPAPTTLRHRLDKASCLSQGFTVMTFVLDHVINRQRGWLAGITRPLIVVIVNSCWGWGEGEGRSQRFEGWVRMGGWVPQSLDCLIWGLIKCVCLCVWMLTCTWTWTSWPSSICLHSSLASNAGD